MHARDLGGGGAAAAAHQRVHYTHTKTYRVEPGVSDGEGRGVKISHVAALEILVALCRLHAAPFVRQSTAQLATRESLRTQPPSLPPFPLLWPPSAFSPKPPPSLPTRLLPSLSPSSLSHAHSTSSPFYIHTTARDLPTTVHLLVTDLLWVIPILGCTFVAIPELQNAAVEVPLRWEDVSEGGE